MPAQISKLGINGNYDNNKTEDIATENVHNNNKASNESKTTASIGSKTREKEGSNSKETTSTNKIKKEKDYTNKPNKEQLEEKEDTGKRKKVLQKSAENETQTEVQEKIMGKLTTEQAQILETIGKKEENMKQEIMKISQKETPTIPRNMEL